jgi:nucleoside-triphosphatase THEP1
MIVSFTGPKGIGKSTIIKKLIEKYPYAEEIRKDVFNGLVCLFDRKDIFDDSGFKLIELNMDELMEMMCIGENMIRIALITYNPALIYKRMLLDGLIFDEKINLFFEEIKAEVREIIHHDCLFDLTIEVNEENEDFVFDHVIGFLAPYLDNHLS